jgi:phage terminase small subunit
MAEAQVGKRGPFLKTKAGLLVNPFIGVAAKCVDTMRKLLIEFGCTPSSRSKAARVERPKEKSALEKLIDGA